IPVNIIQHDFVTENRIDNLIGIDKINTDEETQLIILKILYRFHKQKKKIGRKQMSIELEKYNVYKSEQEVRYHFKLLEQDNFVIIGLGRGGTQITKNGIENLKSNNKL
ncbi:MAG: winged-helix domain-containing protein, partial [Bacteroidales bacterium]